MFIRIREINTAKETFAAKALVEAQWRETKLDGLEIEVGGWLIRVISLGHREKTTRNKIFSQYRNLIFF